MNGVVCKTIYAGGGTLGVLQFLINTYMADRDEKNKENVEGKYYVDEQCIDCDLCREEAPNNFTREDNEGYSYVYKQPENDLEEEMCQSALDNCPVEAIGND